MMWCSCMGRSLREEWLYPSRPHDNFRRSPARGRLDHWRTGVSVRVLVPTRNDFREMVRLAVPIVVVQVGLMLMGTVDTIMVGHVSEHALAAVALGNLYFWFAVHFGMGGLLALDPVIAQAVGAKDEPAVARGMQRGILLAGLVAIPTSLVLLPGPALLAALQQPADVVPTSARYAWACIPGVFPFFAFIVLRQSLQAMGRLTPIVLTIIA